MDHWLLVITRSLFPFKLYIFHSMKHDIRDFLFIYSFPLTHFRNLSLDSNTVHGWGSETSPTSFSGRSSQDSVSTLLSLLLPKITGPSSTSHSMWCRMSPQSRYGGPDKWTRFYSLLVAFILGYLFIRHYPLLCCAYKTHRPSPSMDSCFLIKKIVPPFKCGQKNPLPR